MAKTISQLYVDNPVATPTGNEKIEIVDSLGASGAMLLSIIHGLPFPTYTVAGVPSAAIAGKMIYVSNESGGAVMAFSDGVNWRRVTDRAIVT